VLAIPALGLQLDAQRLDSGPRGLLAGVLVRFRCQDKYDCRCPKEISLYKRLQHFDSKLVEDSLAEIVDMIQIEVDLPQSVTKAAFCQPITLHDPELLRASKRTALSKCVVRHHHMLRGTAHTHCLGLQGLSNRP
jgi:hypothetical protein